jgi:transketolase
LFVYLYSGFLKISPQTVSDPSRDFVFLSKGHDVPALYGVLAETGYIDVGRLKNHLKASDQVYWHPNRAIPGVEFHSGSLGHLPAVALGVALDCRLRQQKNRILVITGDGELNEGSVWETLLVASAKELNQFTLVVDRNQFQANMATEDLLPLEPMEDKFRSFGAICKRVNGHSFTDLHEVFLQLPFDEKKPSVIIADTVRGRGLPSIEARADRWFCNFSHEEVSLLLKELHGAGDTDLVSETLVVR